MKRVFDRKYSEEVYLRDCQPGDVFDIRFYDKYGFRYSYLKLTLVKIKSIPNGDLQIKATSLSSSNRKVHKYNLKNNHRVTRHVTMAPKTIHSNNESSYRGLLE